MTLFSEGPVLEEITETFDKMMEEIQCEKFIALGHILENMFSLNVKNAQTIMNFLIYIYEKGMIEKEDIKHG